jgi:UDP-N-acetylglucosamine:LPS N-acetylglucosamine transferase
MPKKKVLAISSGGGHFVQLLRLKPAWQHSEIFYASVQPSAEEKVHPAPFYTFTDVSRADIWRLPRSIYDIAKIIMKVKPDVIITTGALPGLIAIALAKPFRIKTLWVDSIANAEILSGSGKQAIGVADQVITQWPHLIDDKVEYWGSVL